MSYFPPRYRLLCDQRQRDEGVSLSRLSESTDGMLRLRGLPGLAASGVILVPAPYDASSSGMTCGKDRTDVSAVTSVDDRILIGGCGCRDYEVIRGPFGGGPQDSFKLPRGLLLVGDQLFVADTGKGRVLALELPTFCKLGDWTSGLQNPTGLAADSTDRVYVLDAGTKQVVRIAPASKVESSFSITLTRPIGITIDGQDVLFVTDADLIRRFDTSGTDLGAITAPAPVFKPRAMAARGVQLYVADAESGFIWAFDTETRSWLGKVPAYRGPVSALAIDSAGALYVKPGADETVYRFDADAARVESGTLLAGPLDAGEGDAWERVWVDAEIPAETSVLLEVATSPDGTTPPGGLVWKHALSLDLLLRTLVQGDAARFVWLRVTLQSHDGRSTPTLLQVRASTLQASYLDHLPAIYRREDAATGFLDRWLALFRSELSDWDRALEDVPRGLDVRTVGEGDLAQLAAWLALVPPPGMAVADLRQLLAEAPALYRQRGTPLGLRELARREFGARIHLFEAFRERHIWQLGEGLGLGLDTALAAGTPGGVVVPGFTYSDRRLFGLRGDYYEGTKFEILRHTRHDDTIDFQWADKSPLDGVTPPVAFPANFFSVRWTGQVRPRYAETYTFRTLSDDGIRLWVAGRKIIDNWTDHPPSTDAGQIRLEAGRWYPIVLEFFEKAGNAQIELYWSSASQRQEIVPQECLYSVLTDTAEMAPERQGGCELLEVGHAVVGESRPQGPDDYGAALADDHAHLFTVMVAASQVPLAAQRQALRDLIEAEKPAHTDFRLCLVEPRMRVGVQARVGIDAIVAGAAPPLRLGTAELGSDSYLAGPAPRSWDRVEGRQATPASGAPCS